MHFIQEELERGKRVFVFLGEAGSGKSEIAVNWALMAVSMHKKVRFFDMDQTKPLFRSREFAEMLRQSGVVIEAQQQVLDAPIIPSGVFDGLTEPESIIILDIGGNTAGARCLGQFAPAWDAAVSAYLVINCYRPFSNNERNIAQTINSILTASRLNHVALISNPNFGEATTLEDIIKGFKLTNIMLQDLQYRSDLLVVPNVLEEDVKDNLPNVNVLGINRYIMPPCELRNRIFDKRRVCYGENHD